MKMTAKNFLKNFMKKWTAFLLAAVLAVGVCPAAVSAAAATAVKLSGQEYYSYAFQVLDIVNKERTKRGLSKLAMDKEMLEAAMQRAAEINVSFSHTRPDGSSCFTVFPKGLMGMGENIAAGQGSPKAVMNSWMNSPGHKANILDESGYGYNVIGIGCYKAGNCLYWVQTFGAKASVDKAAKSDYKDGKKTRTVQADSSVLNISMSVSSSTINRGSTAAIRMNLKNQAMSYDSITLAASQFTFKSMNPGTASVTGKGVVKGLKKGKAKIKVSLKKGGFSKTVTITVK